MIKRISPTMLRTAALGLLIAGSSLGIKAANRSNNSYMSEPDRTELISREGAEALKVNSIQVVNQNSVPTEHNSKLDATIRKFIEDDNDRKDINDLINSSYNDVGTFMATAYVQHDLNVRMLYTFMTGNTKLLREGKIAPNFADKIDSYGDDFYKTVKPNAEKVLKWIFEKYNPYFASKMSFDHKPTANEVLKKLDNVIKNEPALTDDEKLQILSMTDTYENGTLQNKKDTQSLANLIAYKINKYDTYMLFKKLVDAGIYNNGYYRRSNKDIKDFYLEWMGKISPINFDNKNL